MIQIMRVLLVAGLVMSGGTGMGQTHSGLSPLFMAPDTVASDSSSFMYYSNGNVHHRIDFAKGERIRSLSFDSLGHRFFDLRYRDGKQDGIGVEWDENGKVRSLSTYDRGNGFYTSFYPNGSVAYLIEHVNSRPAGEFTEWWPNGMLKQRFNFDSTLQVVRCFHANGKLESEGMFLEGQAQVGPWKEYYETGVLKTAGSWRDIRAVPGSRNSNSQKCGEWIYYSADGAQESVEQHEPCPPN